jgi:hypothetical protein
MKYNLEVPIFKYSVDNWKTTKSKILKIINRYENKGFHVVEADPHADDGTAVQSDYFLYKTSKSGPPYAKPIMEILSPYVNHFKEDVNLQDIPYILHGMWYQRTYKDQYHGIHDHGPEGFSSVIYVELDDGQTPTVFYGEYGLSTLCPDAKEGDILFFPSWVKHQGGSNPLEKSRTIISFNMLRKEKIINDNITGVQV